MEIYGNHWKLGQKVQPVTSVIIYKQAAVAVSVAMSEL